MLVHFYLLIQDLFSDHWRYKLSLDSSTAQAGDCMVKYMADSHFSLKLAIRGRLGGAAPPGPAGTARRGCGSPAAGRPAPASWRRPRAERGRSPPHASGRTRAGDSHRRNRRRRRRPPSPPSPPPLPPEPGRRRQQADVRRGPGPPLTHPAPPPRLRRAAAGFPSAPGPASPQRRGSPRQGLAVPAELGSPKRPSGCCWPRVRAVLRRPGVRAGAE